MVEGMKSRHNRSMIIIIAGIIIGIPGVLICGGIGAWIVLHGIHSSEVSNFLATANVAVGLLEVGEADRDYGAWQAHFSELRVAYSRIDSDDPQRVQCSTILFKVELAGRAQKNLRYYTGSQLEEEQAEVEKRIAALRAKLAGPL